MKTKAYMISGFGILLLMLTGCAQINTTVEDMTGAVGIANPASVYCEENGGTLELIFDNGESYGICHFPNGEFCEEREYYRKECFPATNNSGTHNKNVNNFETCVQEGNTVMESYPRQCKTTDGKIFIEEIDKSTDEDNSILGEEKLEEITDTIACTADAKACPDGSYVGRIGPDCEFAPCPNKEKTDEEINTNDSTITDMFQEHKDKDSYQSEGLTEDDIDLMEEIIEKLK